MTILASIALGAVALMGASHLAALRVERHRPEKRDFIIGLRKPTENTNRWS
ncbi:hypothetical protein [Xaviernesmea oryzae]|uniref:hypothetical protein n=1 Tax=Xaviernesmea oryzae TaxID=464029 RepID=UPI0008D11639|nr:hypothetical protein [Xaviernesmea oryzae]SEK69595.1 hypothetical protein SAMN04487976_103310 [Xaviernesmea oryzae]